MKFYENLSVRVVLYLESGSDKTRLIVSSESCFVHVVDKCTECLTAAWIHIWAWCINEVAGNTALYCALNSIQIMEDRIWNMMAHTQKSDFVFRAKWTSPFKLAGARQFSRLLAAELCGISGSNAGYTMFRGSVKGTGYPLHLPVSPSLPLPCDTVCHHISTGVYLLPNDAVLAARTL